MLVKGRKSKAEKALEKLCNSKFYEHASHVQFSVFDLGKVQASFCEAVRDGANADDAMIAAVAKYRLN